MIALPNALRRAAALCAVLLFSTMALCALGGNTRSGSLSERDEYEVKAVYLLKFLPFITWPEGRFASEEAPIVVAVLGKDPFGSKLEHAVEGKTVGKRPVRIERIDDVRLVRKCHLVFVSSSWLGSEKELFAEAEATGIVLVGDNEGFAERGAAINFYVFEDKLRFEINVKAYKRAGLEISSKLLKLARIVEEGR